MSPGQWEALPMLWSHCFLLPVDPGTEVPCLSLHHNEEGSFSREETIGCPNCNVSWICIWNGREPDPYQLLGLVTPPLLSLVYVRQKLTLGLDFHSTFPACICDLDAKATHLQKGTFS